MSFEFVAVEGTVAEVESITIEIKCITQCVFDSTRRLVVGDKWRGFTFGGFIGIIVGVIGGGGVALD